MKSPSLVTSHFGPLQPAIERARLLPELGVLRQEDGAPQTAVPGFVPGSPPSAAAIERLIVRARASRNRYLQALWRAGMQRLARLPFG